MLRFSTMATTLGALLAGLAGECRAGIIYAAVDGGAIVAVDSTTGQTKTVATGLNGLRNVAVDNQGLLYATLVTLNLGQDVSEIVKFSTGAAIRVAQVMGSDGGIGALTVGASGDLYAAAYFSANILKVTAAGVVSDYARQVGGGVVGLAFDPSGNLYAANTASGNIGKTTPDGKSSVFFEFFPAGGSFRDVVSDSAGYLYATARLFDSQRNLNPTLFKINSSGGYVTIATGHSSPNQLTFGDGGSLFVSSGNSLSRLSSNGSASPFATLGGQIYDLAYSSQPFSTLTAVPEPSTLAGAGVGLALLVGAAVRRRQAASI